MSENYTVTTWQEALLHIIQASASIAPILLLLPSKSDASSRSLLPFSSENNINVVQFINNRPVYIANDNFQPLKSTIKYYKVIKSTFVICFLHYSASDLKKDISAWIKNDLWSSRGVVVVTVLSGVSTPAQIAEEILQELWRQCQAANAYVVVQNTRKTFYIYKGAAYTSSCAVQPREVNTCQAFKQEAIWNVNSCLLKAVSAEKQPYVFALNSSQFFTDGLEVRVFETLAEMLNFTFIYVFSPPNEEPFDSGLKGTPRGTLGVLLRREADIMFYGATMSRYRSIYADALYPYHSSSYVWAVPLPEPIPVWKTFFIVFDTPMWCAIGLVLPIVVVCFWTFTRNSLATDIVLSVMQISLSTSTQFQFPSYTFKLFIALFLVYVVNITAAYQAGMFKILSSGVFYPQPDNLFGALEMGYRLAVSSLMMDYLKEDNPRLYKRLMASGQIDWTTDTSGIWDRIAQGERIMSSISDITLKLRTIQRYTSAHGKAQISKLRQRYSSYGIVFYMSKDHPLYAAFQLKLRDLVEMGLIDKFWHDVYENARRKRRNWPPTQSLSRDLSKLYAVSAVTMMALCVLTVSCLIFAVEYFYILYINRTGLKIRPKNQDTRF